MRQTRYNVDDDDEEDGDEYDDDVDEYDVDDDEYDDDDEVWLSLSFTHSLTSSLTHYDRILPCTNGMEDVVTKSVTS